MNISIGKRWQEFVEEAVASGRYKSASQLICEGLKLVEEREARLLALRRAVQEAVAVGGDHSDDDIGRDLEQVLDELKQQGL